jgi:hypothetical protein
LLSVPIKDRSTGLCDLCQSELSVSARTTVQGQTCWQVSPEHSKYPATKHLTQMEQQVAAVSLVCLCARSPTKIYKIT